MYSRPDMRFDRPQPPDLCAAPTSQGYVRKAREDVLKPLRVTILYAWLLISTRMISYVQTLVT